MRRGLGSKETPASTKQGSKGRGPDTTREQRLYSRYPISRRGELSDQQNRFPCLIQDISAKGFCIICARDPVVGQELDLRFELVPKYYHQCKIQVQHIKDGCLGSQITEIGESEYKTYQQFLRQYSKG